MLDTNSEIIKSVLLHLPQDELNKALNDLSNDYLIKAVKKAGLVYVQKQVQRKGKTFMQGVWVKPDEAKNLKNNQMKETHEMHKSDGKYTQGRVQLHQRIIDKIVSECGKPKAGEKPVAILMGGGSASGKSTMRSKIIEKDLSRQGVKAGTIDSDEIKNEIPEFDSLKKSHPEEAAKLVHEESSDIGAHALDTIMSQGRNFIYDGTMKSGKKYKELVAKLKKAGYEIHAYVADVPLKEAISRSDKRASKSGRKVPHEIIESSHRGVPNTFEQIKGDLDNYHVFDNTHGLKLIHNPEYTHPELYGRFLDKGGVKHELTPRKESKDKLKEKTVSKKKFSKKADKQKAKNKN